MKSTQSKPKSESTHHSVPNKENSSFFPNIASNEASFFSPAFIQPKLKIGAPDDKYEREADRVADAVVSSPAPDLQMLTLEDDKKIQMKCKECEEESLQMKSDHSQSSVKIPIDISRQIQNSGSGSPLPGNINREMSQKMGSDFSDVNIHTGSEAVHLNEVLGARAFTYGNDIYFNVGEYAPNTLVGKHLMAHELVHTIQQNKYQLIQREPATAITIGTVLAWCLSGAGVTVLFDTIFQVGKGLWTGRLSWNYCKAIISALLGCVFGLVGGSIAAHLTREIGKVTMREFSAWVYRKLVVAGYTQLAGKWGASVAKLGCDEMEIDLYEFEGGGISSGVEDLVEVLPGHDAALTGDTRSSSRRDTDNFMNIINEQRLSE